MFNTFFNLSSQTIGDTADKGWVYQSFLKDWWTASFMINGEEFEAFDRCTGYSDASQKVKDRRQLILYIPDDAIATVVCPDTPDLGVSETGLSVNVTLREILKFDLDWNSRFGFYGNTISRDIFESVSFKRDNDSPSGFSIYFARLKTVQDVYRNVIVQSKMNDLSASMVIGGRNER